MGQHIPDLEKALKIKITKEGPTFRADATILPGTPLVGIGKTKIEAKYNLCVNWLYMFARYHSSQYDSWNSGDLGYVPIIEQLLNEDLNKI